MERNTVTPEEITPVLTKDEAVLKAKDIQSKLGELAVVSTELTVFRPNYYWESTDGAYKEADYVRVAWCIKLEDSSSIYVDARTGEILGGSSTLGVRARAVSAVPTVYRVGECVTLAVSGLQRLGYTHHLNSVNYVIFQNDIEYILNGSQLKGLFLTCHGLNNDNLGIICDSTDLESAHWVFPSNKINSNYKFVFLNACWSSVNDNFKGAFLGSNRTGKAFVGWNVRIGQGTAYYFNTQFWPLVGTMPVLDAVLAARAATLSAGYSDCNPGFSGDASYYGWA